MSYAYFQGGDPLGSTAPTTVGSYTVVATFAGNTDYAAASGAAVPFSITQATPTVSVTDLGGTYTGNPFAATAASVSGTATDGTIASFGDASLSYAYFQGADPLGGTAPTAVGSYTVVAAFAGNTDYAAASSAAVPFSITQATPTVSVTDLGGTYTGNPFAATAASVSGTATDGTIASFGDASLSYAYFQGGDPLGGTAPTTVGSYTVVAAFAGNTDYAAASSAAAPFSITQATPTVSVTDAGGTYTGNPFAATAASVSGTATDGTIASFGNASLSYAYFQGADPLGGTAPTAVGSYTVVATFAGNTDYAAASSVAAPFSITQATPTVSVTDAGGTYTGNPFAATAASVSGTATNGTIASFGDASLSYAYFQGGDPLGGTAPTAVGSYTVVATFAGNTDYAAASSAAVPFSITQATPTVSVTDAGGTYTGNPFAATAASVSGTATDGTIATFGNASLSYAYFQGGDPLGGTAPTAVGSYTVVAAFAGNTDYAPASSSPVTFTISPTPVVISSPLADCTVNALQESSVIVSGTAGVNDTIVVTFTDTPRLRRTR